VKESGSVTRNRSSNAAGGKYAPIAGVARDAERQRRRCLPGLAFVAAVLLLPSATATAEVINRIVAKVDGEPITLHELNQYRDNSIRARQALQGASQSVVLESLITEKLIEREVRDVGVIVREEDVSRYINGIKERNRISEEQLEEALAAQGLTLPQYRVQVREELQRQQLVNREIRGKVNVTPEEVQRYYTAHLSDYALPGGMQVAHIVFALPERASAEQVNSTKAQAEEVLGRIRDGADFAEMARTYSQDASAESDGTLGWFSEGELYDSLEEVVVKLDVGAVAGPIRSPVGMHILKLLDRRDTSHRPVDEVADQIKEKLYAEALEERFQRWLTEELRDRHHVEVDL
jgi:peptidyl-prolyl cis-trans isomerase SurA